MPNLNFDQKFYTKDNQQHSEWQGVAVTGNDSTDLTNGACDAIYVTGAGNVSFDTPNTSLTDGTATSRTANVIAFAANSVIYVRATRIRATSTTATGIFALYKANNTI